MDDMTASIGWRSLDLAKAYFHNSEIQRQGGWNLLGSHPFKVDETVLDFGCGDGKISAEISHFVKKGRVVGVDLSESMIQLAKLYFPPFAFPNLEFYENLPELLFDRIVSFFVLHLVDDPLAILKNLRKHLKVSGKLLLVIPTNPHPHMVLADHDTRVKFNLPGSASQPSRVRNLDWAHGILKESGYKIEYAELEEKICPFADSNEMIQWMTGTFTANMGIPENISHSFFKEMFNRWLELDPQRVDREGRVLFQMDRLNLVATH
jgi:trans-aconitate 2-methyltransferase